MIIYCDSSLTEACVLAPPSEPLFFPYADAPTTNNIGEFRAVCYAVAFSDLAIMKDGIPLPITIYSDSQFVVNQVRGYDDNGAGWKHCKEKFKPYRDYIREFLALNSGVTLVWCPREENLAGIELERRKKGSKT
jgi:ribonuclease HI